MVLLFRPLGVYLEVMYCSSQRDSPNTYFVIRLTEKILPHRYVCSNRILLFRSKSFSSWSIK